MRRLLAVILLPFSIVTAACSAKPTTVMNSFCAQAEWIWRDQTLRGTVVCRSADGTVVTLSEPSYVNGLTMQWDGERLHTRFADEYIAQETALPMALPRLLHEVYEAVDVGHTDGEIYGCRYSCEYDDSTGLPVSVTFSDTPLIVRFSNVICLGET